MPRTPSSAVGSIPKRLRVVIAMAQDLMKITDGIKRDAHVRPALFQDVNTDPRAALSWGTRQKELTPKGTPHIQRKWETVEPEVLERDNKPMTNLKFWAIDERAEGGRAYKVIDEDGLLFDMREDIVEEAFFYNEFQDNTFTGQYIWAKCHSQMRLIRLGSQLYMDLLEAGRRKELKKIPNKELVVGTVYMNRKGERHVYLGRKPGKVKDGGGFYFLEMQRHLPYGEKANEDHQRAFDRVVELFKEYSYYKPIPCDSHTMVEAVGTVNTRGQEV